MYRVQLNAVVLGTIMVACGAQQMAPVAASSASPQAAPPSQPAPISAKPSLEAQPTTELVGASRNRFNERTEDDGGGEGALAPNQGPRPDPEEITFMECPGEGDGGDPALNLLKNRVDQPPTVHATAIAEVIAIPATASKKHRADWTEAQRTAVAQYEGTPVRIAGFLVDAKKEGVESPNCHDEDDAQRDFHLYLVSDASEDKASSVIVEITPRIRKDNPGWTLSTMRKIAKAKDEVRITGWLMFDQEHASEVGKSRATLWEVHPITTFEVRRGNKWTKL
jgi:hypothetical protein